MDGKIDINNADEEMLTTLPGVGDALARRIIEYRQTVHPFEEIIELTAVPGISERMVREFEDQITVTTQMTAATAVSDVDLIPTAPVVEPETTAVLDEDEAAAEPPSLEEIGLMDAHPDAETAVAPEPVAEEMIPEEASETAEEETAVTSESAPDASADEETAPLSAPRAATEIESTSEPEPESKPGAEPTPVVQATPPPANWEAQAQRRGCFSAIIGAAFGAILGTALTLALLAALNRGALTFVDADAQLRRQINTEAISRTNQINTLTTRLEQIETERAATETELMSTITALEGEVTADLESLAETDAELDERIDSVAGAAATFNDFLDGLRGLLDEIEGPADEDEVESTPPSATPIPQITPTPTATVVETPTSSPTSTETAVPPTRTPRPTATPLVFPTNTPAQQP